MNKRRSRRAKYVTLYSSHLMRLTKHELIGEPTETEKGRYQWARCTKTRHCQLVDLDRLEQDGDPSDVTIRVSIEDAIKYNPMSEYKIGDIIYHPKWDDIGIVRSKETLSNGNKAIVVHFEKSSEKRLIENLNSSVVQIVEKKK